MYRNERDWVYETESFPFQFYVSGLANGSADVASAVFKLKHEDGTTFELTYPADMALGNSGVYTVFSSLPSKPFLAGSAGDMDYQLWVTSVQGTERCVAQGTLRIVATL